MPPQRLSSRRSASGLPGGAGPANPRLGSTSTRPACYADIVGSPDVVRSRWLSVSVDGVPHDTTDPVIVAPGALVYSDGHEIRATPAQDL